MQNGWKPDCGLLSIEDQLREQLLFAETRIFQLERENAFLRGSYPSERPRLTAPKVRPKLTEQAAGAPVLPIVPTTRKYIFRAFMGRCFYCVCELSESRFTVDHQIPKCKGGRNHRDNLVLACGTCNTTKGDRMPTPNELERANGIRKAYDSRPANAEPIRDPWIAQMEEKIEQAIKPNSIYTVRNNMP